MAAIAHLNEQLLIAACQGDAAALEQVLTLSRPDLRRYASLTCLTTADAEDAVQESLLIVYRKLSALRSVATFSQWVFRIVKRECLRLMHPGHIDLALVAEKSYLGTRTDPELRFDIARAIQSLPDRYRNIIVLRDFEELTIREIADRLGLVPETVKTRLYRGRQLVREHLLT